MIIISIQLNDWGETSANMAIELTEYFISHYNIDTNKFYLHRMSGGNSFSSDEEIMGWLFSKVKQ